MKLLSDDGEYFSISMPGSMEKSLLSWKGWRIWPFSCEWDFRGMWQPTFDAGQSLPALLYLAVWWGWGNCIIVYMKVWNEIILCKNLVLWLIDNMCMHQELSGSIPLMEFDFANPIHSCNGKIKVSMVDVVSIILLDAV